MVTKWRFDDLTNSETYTFDINPSEGGSLAYKKNVSYANTAAPDGKTLIFEGRDEAMTSSFNGTILTQDQYEAMIEWFSKRHQIRVTDDLGRQFMIYITSFEPTRERAIHYPYKHKYTVNYTILDWVD